MSETDLYAQETQILKSVTACVSEIMPEIHGISDIIDIFQQLTIKTKELFIYLFLYRERRMQTEASLL